MATATNTAAIVFEAAPADAVGDDATHYGIWDAATNGNFLGGDTIGTNPTPLELGERYEIEASSITLTFLRGTDGFTEEMAKRQRDGAVSGTLYISVHDGDPGTTGANEITDLDRATIAESGWTKADTA